MEVVRRIIPSMDVDHLNDASLVRLIRVYTSWYVGIRYAEMRKKISILGQIEGIHLDDLATKEEMNRMFDEISDIEKYPC